MIVNRHNLNSLYIAFSAAFARGLGEAPSDFAQVATVVPSTTKENEYGWLGKLPGMREWIGDRVIHGLMAHGYSIKNKPFESTVGVDRDDIEDDNIGIYSPLFQELGAASGAHPDELVFRLLGQGHNVLCYDGQPFFDTDHPVIDAEGETVSQSNDMGGSDTSWYLLSTNRPLKPLIFQRRKAPQFVRMDAETDEAVFTRKEFRYGVDARHNVGFGFWQMAVKSSKELTAPNLQEAYTAMTERTGDHGRPLGIRPNLLVVPPGLKFKAAELLQAERNAAGATNIMRGMVDALDTPWLAAA